MTTSATSKSTSSPIISPESLQAIGRPAIQFLTWFLPVLITGIRAAYFQFNALPQNRIYFILGTILCFFGGTFPTLFAALQAAEQGGRLKVMEALSDLADEALIIIEASKKDDGQDLDKDGKKDVDEISSSELLARKTRLVLQKMHPKKVDAALSSLYTVWLAVAAVLSIQFARTISMALAIATFIKKPMNRYVTPAINLAIPKEYEQWTPVVIGWAVKSFAMSIAWWIQSVVSAFTSALTGGLMMAHATYHFCKHRKIDLFGMMPENHEDSHVDEILSYVFAALGFLFQFQNHFQLPFPLNIILWPFQIAEYWIRWTITSKLK